MRRIKNFIENYRKLGKRKVLEFYSKNILFNEQVNFNSSPLLKCIIKDLILMLNKNSRNIVQRILTSLRIIPKVSVLMSVYNSQNYLKESIESILNQNLRDFEFLIMDDASSDGSYGILENYAKKDRRVKLFRNENNLGLTKSLNILLRYAKGNTIARMDADDISLPTRLSKEYEFLGKNKNVFLVGTGIYHIDIKGAVILKPTLLTGTLEIAEMLPINNCLYHSTIMFRNEGFRYREKFLYAQDYDFYLCLLSAKKRMCNLKERLLLYRISDSSISKKKKKNQERFAQKAKRFYFERLSSKKDSYEVF